MIQYLDWDSRFFEKKIGKSESEILTKASLKTLLKEKSTEGYDLIYLFTTQTDHEAEVILNNRHCPVLDHKITYVIDNIQGPATTAPFITHYKGPLTEDLLRLAVLSGHESRFRKDRFLSPKFESLYTQWISKSLSGQLADVVLIATINNTIKGFVTIKKKSLHGQIGLIAIDPAVQKQGIGTELMKAAHNWYYQNHLTNAFVTTQLTNTGACRLYEKSGYSVYNTQLIYHL
ncbi:GNAT family N-acetyltransferase [Geofilum sp. OHC36d9]|uniref:GNAT family N-acetyltransferase n=1 Tax=Geofilum sp. OHC36d9 TaxID=3458413 RepID=UPI0040348995